MYIKMCIKICILKNTRMTKCAAHKKQNSIRKSDANYRSSKVDFIRLLIM